MIMKRLQKPRIFLDIDWRRWTVGISFNRYRDDWKIYFPVITVVIWLRGW